PRRIIVRRRQPHREPTAFDTQWLREPQAELVAAAQDTGLRQVEGISAGLEHARAETGPAAARHQVRAPAVAEVVPRFGVEEQRRRTAAAQRRSQAPAEQSLFFFET